MPIDNNIGYLVVEYDRYARECKLKNEEPKSFIRYIYNCLTGKNI